MKLSKTFKNIADNSNKGLLRKQVEANKTQLNDLKEAVAELKEVNELQAILAEQEATMKELRKELGLIKK